MEHAGRSRRAAAAVKVWINGDLVNEGANATADRGRIALQAEGTEVEFRRVDLMPLLAGREVSTLA